MTANNQKNNMSIYDDHLVRNSEAYSPGVLNPRQHFNLVEELPKYCLVAGISTKFVTHSMLDFCNGNPEIDWMRSFPAHAENNTFGAVFIGSDDVLVRMSAMVGCALRNYIQARLVTIQTIISELKDGVVPDEDLLCISNFCLPKAQGGAIPSWQLPIIIGMLYDRYIQQKQTILYVSSLGDIKSQYGVVIHKHIISYFDNF